VQRVQAQGHRTTRRALSMTSPIALSLIVVGFAAANEFQPSLSVDRSLESWAPHAERECADLIVIEKSRKGMTSAIVVYKQYGPGQRHHLVDGYLVHTSTDKKEQSFATDEDVIQTDHDRGDTDLILKLHAGGEPRADVQPNGRVPNRPQGGLEMTLSEEQNTKMKKAITQAIKVMGDRFGSTDGDVARSIQELKASMQTPVATPVTIQE